MSATHTPGPWRFEWDGRPTWSCVRHRVKGEWQVAVTDDLIDEHPEESEANARLIAAAPELLAALKEALYAVTEIDNAHKSLRQMRAAIAKAEGRS